MVCARSHALVNASSARVRACVHACVRACVRAHTLVACVHTHACVYAYKKFNSSRQCRGPEQNYLSVRVSGGGHSGKQCMDVCMHVCACLCIDLRMDVAIHVKTCLCADMRVMVCTAMFVDVCCYVFPRDMSVLRTDVHQCSCICRHVLPPIQKSRGWGSKIEFLCGMSIFFSQTLF